MAILAAAGDPGGARALLPALRKVLALGGRVVAWEHRGLPALLPGAGIWKGGELPDCGRLVFGTSVADPAPLALARRCRATGMRVDCVLDNWMNYRRRLEMDGAGLFVPDAYYVMDDLAREEAIKEGIPAGVLVAAGHPGLSDLRLPPAGEREAARAALRKALAIPESHGLLVFASEPVEKDQGADASRDGYRGYTEKQALAVLCEGVRREGGKWGLCILPHPREDLDELARSWKASAGALCGGVLRAPLVESNAAVAAADGVAGMASILVYVAWLLGRPALSLQPGLARPDLRIYRTRAGVHCYEAAADAGRIAAWLAEARRGGGAPRPELELHRGAAEALARAWLEPPR